MQPTAQNHFQNMKTAVLNPKTFFTNISETENFSKPTIFIVINIVITLVLSFLFSIVLSAKSQSMFSFGSLVVVLPMMLIVFAVTLLVTTAILHVIAKILGGKGKFLNTYQAIAYASAVSPLTAIPVLGFLASFYQLYLVIIGLKRFHQYSTVKAVLNVLIPVVFVIVIAGVAVALLGVAAIGLMKSTGLKPDDLKNLQNLQNIQKPEDLQNLYPTFVPKNDADYPTDYQDYNTAE